MAYFNRRKIFFSDFSTIKAFSKLLLRIQYTLNDSL